MSEAALGLKDELALNRTRMAVDRTLMAWVRTALSMISFGFTIYKFLQVLQEQSTVPVLRPNAPGNVGLALTGIGTSALIVAAIQYLRQMKELRPGRPREVWSLTLVVACLIALLGLLVFASILFRSGPFG